MREISRMNESDVLDALAQARLALASAKRQGFSGRRRQAQRRIYQYYGRLLELRQLDLPFPSITQSDS